jgi:hypothetical protein
VSNLSFWVHPNGTEYEIFKNPRSGIVKHKVRGSSGEYTLGTPPAYSPGYPAGRP